MMTYGTIPTIPTSSSPGATNLEYISRAQERFKASLGTPQPWQQMFDLNCFNLPSDLSDAVSRINSNAIYFRFNYATIVVAVLFLSLLWYPISLVVCIITMAAWLFFYFLRDEPLVILGRTITDRVVVIVLIVFTIVLLLWTHAMSNILSSISVGFVVVLLHAAFRKTDDLYLDEEAAGFLSAAASVRVPPQAST